MTADRMIKDLHDINYIFYTHGLNKGCIVLVVLHCFSDYIRSCCAPLLTPFHITPPPLHPPLTLPPPSHCHSGAVGGYLLPEHNFYGDY